MAGIFVMFSVILFMSALFLSIAGLLTQGGQGCRAAPLACRSHGIPTHFPLNLHGI
jgi:hypothetical protein